MQQTNFGRNVRITPQTFYTPKSEDEVVDILNRHNGQQIRCVGRRHSWSNILISTDVLIDLRQLDCVAPQQHADEMTVQVGAGCQVKRLLAELQRLKNWTLPSVGFITEQTVAGAIATGTHGSGRHSLSHYVVSVRVARYARNSGQAVIEEVSSGDELLAARCSLGCVGVILSVTMQCRRAYSVEEHFHEYSDLSEVFQAEDKYPLQQFYLAPWHWKYFVQHRRETDAPTSKSISLYHWYRFLVFDISMHLLILFLVRVVRIRILLRAAFRWVVPNCVIRNWRVVGPSAAQLVMEHELFRHVELEIFVKRSQLESALHFLKRTLIFANNKTDEIENTFQEQLKQAECTEAMVRLRGVYCHHYPICIRRIQPDDTLISMTSNATETASLKKDHTQDAADSGEAWYSITLTNYHRGSAGKPFEDLTRFLTVSMARLFGARPHWGKLCSNETRELRELYPAFDRFASVCRHVDPDGLFCNQWTTDLLSATQQPGPSQTLVTSGQS